MKKTAFTLIVLLLFLLSGKMGETIAQTNHVGVAQGDSFSYEVGASGYIPQFQYYDVENIGKVDVNVTSISDRLINFTASITYRNGTRASESTSMDVLTGGITDSSLPRFFLASNLEAGSNVIPYNENSPKINETMSIGYSKGYSREANYFRINGIGSNTTNYSYIDFYYDKQTGALVEVYCFGKDANGPCWTSYWFKLEKTNLWTISEPSYPSNPPSYLPISSLNDYYYLAVALIAVAAIVGIGLFVYSKRNK